MAQTRIYWLHTLSPTHVGAGRGVGYIDLPIHRDKVTNWPVIPGSAFKGVWRDWAQQNKPEHVVVAFGRASDTENNSNAGALIPTDARLVCLPVRSFHGTFAWCTSALALKLLRRDLAMVQVSGLPPDLQAPPTETVFHANPTALKDAKENRVFLEDLDFTAADNQGADHWAGKIAEWVFPGPDSVWRDEFKKRFAVLPDLVFDYLTETGTEVIARVKIDDDTKTVADGALWNEEALPSESILVGFVSCDRVYGRGVDGQSLLTDFASDPLTLQIGGKATVGRGRVRCLFTPVNGGA